MEKAEVAIVRIVQGHAFFHETVALKTVMAKNRDNDRKMKRREKNRIKKISSLFRLDTFIDEDGLLRDGGKLSR